MTAPAALVWIRSLHELHCPVCDRRLLQRARPCLLPETGALRYVGEVGTLTCVGGHPLPGRPELYDYRRQRRLRAEEAVRARPVSSGEPG